MFATTNSGAICRAALPIQHVPQREQVDWRSCCETGLRTRGLSQPGAVEVRKQEVRGIETLRIHHGQREGMR